MHHFNANSNIRIVDTSLVNKILEQGQKLRNAMVGSILKNDPFNTDIIYGKHFNTPKTSSSDLDIVPRIDPPTLFDERRVEAYVRGEYMTKEEERLALETLRSMSAPELCKTTERTLNSGRLSTCKCYICEIYNSNSVYCDLKRKNKDLGSTNQSNEMTKDIQEKYESENKTLLKYVDSLKVVINSLTLNETGNRKVSVNDKVPYNNSQTYFLEYSIPDYLSNKCIVSKSKTNSGLENNITRFCSRRSNGSINFKQITIHDIKNLDKCNLDEYKIRFKISYRTQKQKNASILGFAEFNLSSFLLSKNLVFTRSLPVCLSENSPIIVGHLKVSLSLGCGRLYFGQEFIDAINSINGNSVVLDSDDSTNLLNREESNYNVTTQGDNLSKDNNLKKYSNTNENSRIENGAGEGVPKKTKTYHKRLEISEKKSVVSKPIEKITVKSDIAENIHKKENTKSEHKDEMINGPVNNRLIEPQINENEKRILFGFLYISEVEYLSPPINTYITCRPFGRSETSCSKLITNTSNPVFNFSQLVPLLYDDALLQSFRENYMVIEFWRKIESTDLVIGLTKIPLHQFYLSYRNPVFVKYLSKNQLPIIDIDWWESIHGVETEKVIGQVQIIAAVGTEEQINNLKSERGFADNIVKAKFSNAQSQSMHQKPIVQKLNIEPEQNYNYKLRHENSPVKTGNKFKSNNITHRNTDLNKPEDSKPQEKIRYITSTYTDKAVNTVISPEKVVTPPVQKFDIGTQSNIEMDKVPGVQNEEKVSPTQEMLGNFLNQLMVQRQRNIFVENSTNTEAPETARSRSSQSLEDAQTNTDLKLKKTTDLLDSLQKALSLDGPSNVKTNEIKRGMFRARVTISSANHLPGRKKCKSKKFRNRSIKNEDNILPSCYVTFETSENELKMTPVVLKTTNPSWNYKCDTNLSEDLLTNSQRRLIFKVWKKPTNAVSSPNLQTDIVLGFAAVDLSVLLAGFPNVKGWFNIIDFTGKCNGQINIHVTPLDDLKRYTLRKDDCDCNAPAESNSTKPEEEPSELFSRALKRKFTELDEITQRLRLRLSKVTNDDSDSSSDGVAEEFEKDINTLCVEDDFDLIDFEEETKDFEDKATSSKSSTSKSQALLTMKENDDIADENKVSSSNTATSLTQDAGSILELSSNSAREKELLSLDKHLQEGKQKIDTLLEKLSLISADTNHTFASRYVSGCSLNNDYNAISIDTEAILKELDHSSRPNIQSSLGFEPLKFQQLYGGSCDNSSTKNSGSDTSLITNSSDGRPTPDGQGNI